MGTGRFLPQEGIHASNCKGGLSPVLLQSYCKFIASLLQVYCKFIASLLLGSD